MSDRELGSFMIVADHPCLPGHFPGRPLVPGVVLLDEVFVLIEADAGMAGQIVGGLANAKFLNPVRPDQHVVVHIDRTVRHRLGFTCRVAEIPVLTGSLSLSEPV